MYVSQKVIVSQTPLHLGNTTQTSEYAQNSQQLPIARLRPQMDAQSVSKATTLTQTLLTHPQTPAFQSKPHTHSVLKSQPEPVPPVLRTLIYREMGRVLETQEQKTTTQILIS